jgi:ribosomal protein L3 glutamine methyltransferase
MKSTSLLHPNLKTEDLLLALDSLRDWRRMIITLLSSSDSAASGSTSLSHGHGSANPDGEALQVLSWISRIHPLDLDKHLEAKLCEAEKIQILDKINRRVQTRMPMAYILGEAWFGRLRLKCDARALVPRSLILEALNHSVWETLEHIAPNFADQLSSHGTQMIGSTTDHAPIRILDLCTGGGSIAIQAAIDFPRALITATDLSIEALSLAEENVQLLGLEQQIELHQGHLFEGIAQRFDLILCNPPYVNDESMDVLPAEFLAEPRLALAGGVDGMDLIREIFREAPKYMTDEAQLLLEIGHEAHYFEQAFSWLNYSYVPVAAGENMLVLVSRADLLAQIEAESNL